MFCSFNADSQLDENHFLCFIGCLYQLKMSLIITVGCFRFHLVQNVLRGMGHQLFYGLLMKLIFDFFFQQIFFSFPMSM